MNVGLCEAGVPILGVVGVPAAEDPRTYFAVKGQGAFVEVRRGKLYYFARPTIPFFVYICFFFGRKYCPCVVFFLLSQIFGKQ